MHSLKTGETATHTPLSPLFIPQMVPVRLAHASYSSTNVICTRFPIAAAIFTIKSSDGL